ncbi:hypothetical protein E2C01_029938 [Portunus trituberculatus]|uniref:Uncharacterized protein n=1 Tax=Portunus trituberculatus TaxID=210409 RepID=A0A5B7ETS1_PORTR|nr:hypothetical protein [Portunus trituberculatus]
MELNERARKKKKFYDSFHNHYHHHHHLHPAPPPPPQLPRPTPPPSPPPLPSLLPPHPIVNSERKVEREASPCLVLKKILDVKCHRVGGGGRGGGGRGGRGGKVCLFPCISEVAAGELKRA